MQQRIAFRAQRASELHENIERRLYPDENLDVRTPGSKMTTEGSMSGGFARSPANGAKENMQYNMEAAQLKRAQQAQVHAEDLTQARANLHSEQGFWNLGATSQKVRNARATAVRVVCRGVCELRRGR